jgi:hypothetical protein
MTRNNGAKDVPTSGRDKIKNSIVPTDVPKSESPKVRQTSKPRKTRVAKINPEDQVTKVLGAELPSSEPKSKNNLRSSLLGFVLVVVLFGGALVFNHYQVNNSANIQGKVAMSEDLLINTVKAHHATVYWSGPQAGAKYTLILTKTGQAFVRYLPNGKGLEATTNTFRIIATYPQKNAFSITKIAGTRTGNVGFINVDGNSVFYIKARSTNVYVGIKGKDIQLEIFDPYIDQALAVSLTRGEIAQIK